MQSALFLPEVPSTGSLLRKQFTEGKRLPEMATLLSDYFSPNRLRVLGRQDNFQPDLWAARIGTIQVSTLAYRTAVELEVETAPDHVLVTTQLAGDQRVWSQGLTGAGSAGFVVIDSTPAPVVKRFSADSHRINFRLSRASLSALWQTATGSSRPLPKTFAPFISNEAAKRRWWSHVQLLWNYLDVPPTGAYGARMGRLIEEGIALFLLFEQPHDTLDALIDPHPSTLGERRLDKAEDYMRAHLCEPLTLADIARSADISIRSLHSAVQRRHGLSPMKLIESLRLDRAHEALQAGHGVTRAAADWGFSNSGRFASAYRKRFGVLPSQTGRSTRVRP